MTHTALSAMHAAMQRQSITANNLANVGTAGFRGDMLSADAHYLSNGHGLSARALSSGGIAATNLTAGPVAVTSRSLDVAINGTALIAIQSDAGDEAYTRRGDLTVGATGLLETGDGQLVLGEGGPLSVPPNEGLRIAPNGDVMVRPAGGDGTEQVAGRIRLVSPDGASVVRGLDGNLRAPDGGILPTAPTATLTPGSLEGSNVTATDALVDMIAAARGYETQVRLLTTARELDEGGTRLMRLEG